MKIKEFKANLVSRLINIYDHSESEAIADYFIAETFPSHSGNSLWDNEQEIPAKDKEKLELCIGNLTEGMPVQYVTGKAWFYGHSFIVNEQVLIPRPETEELTSIILNDYREKEEELDVIDIGTGSGCVAVTLKLHHPSFKVIATDISPGALQVAKENSLTLGASVVFIEDDILNSLLATDLKFDIIVSNPPYIPTSETENLHVNVIKYEPSLALFVPDNEPLRFYMAILKFADDHLKPGGKIYFEIHRDFGEELMKRMEKLGIWDSAIRQDMSGNNRFIAVMRK